MSVSVYKVFDATTPPSSPPPYADGVLGYVGRAGLTPHVWTVDQWAPFSHLRQFPCWLPDLGADPAADALEAVKAVESLGWAKYPQPDTRAIVLDGETSRFPSWYSSWAAEVGGLGYFAVDYGSYSFVSANLASEVWGADWDDLPVLEPGQTIGGSQYQAGVTWDGATIDLSVVSAALFARGGVGPRR